MRVFAVSDIHVDYQENRKWFVDLSSSDYREDVLILAGDATDELSLLDQCFYGLAKKFSKVLFVPGNHELWVSRYKHLTSLEKFQKVCDVAKNNNVSIEPFHHRGLSIVPLLGWYDFSFGEPCVKLKESWRDFRTCVWPNQWLERDITEFFLEKNEPHLKVGNEVVISFSHFLPRIDLMPIYIPKAYRYLYPILGSVGLERSVRALKPQIHVYGHSHVNNGTTIDGIHYVNNAFGYPAEDRIARKELLCIYEY